MAILAAKAYDPSTAASAATTAALAMTALDTTNLRLTFTAPASGRVWVQAIGTVHGAATYPQILLGAMSGATVVARAAPQAVVGGTALATTMMNVAVMIPVTGLTPGASLTYDAAYAVETAVASTAIKWGGPNDTTVNNAFGAFVFAIHDLG